MLSHFSFPTLTFSFLPVCVFTKQKGMDFGKNTKTNDGNIHDVLYSGGNDNFSNKYDLPADPGSGPAYMQQPMNRP